jgi:transcriptional regulator GlxA family with amidase domain
MVEVAVILFDGFETLDAFGPIEVIGKLDSHYKIALYSENGGEVRSSQGFGIGTRPIADAGCGGILLIPGGMGARREADNAAFIQKLKALAADAEYVLTVCTGSGLLARTGLLDHRKATSNKMAFEWAAEQGANVQWVRRARWASDGKYYTSSGVSAGIDMALGFVADRMGAAVAERIAKGIEYVWNKDRDCDLFA